MTARHTAPKPISPREWLPFAALLFLAALFFATPPGSDARRLALLVGVGLLPGCLARLAGKSSWGVHRVCFAAALVAYMFGNPRLRPGPAEVERLFAGWSLIALGFAVSFSQPLWGAARLRRLLADSGVGIPFGKTFRLCLAGSFFNIVLPGSTGGDIYRVYAVAGGARDRAVKAVAVIAVDRLLGMPPFALMVLAAAALDRDFVFAHKPLSGPATFASIVALVCLAAVAWLWLGRGKRATSAGPDAGGGGRLRRIRHLLAASISTPSTLPIALLCGLLSHVAAAAACVLFGMAAGVEGIPPLRYFLLVPLALAVNAIPAAPGGVGQGEIALATLFDLAAPGLGNAQSGVAVMLLLRLSNIAIGLAGGVVYAAGGVRLVPAGGGDGADRCP